MLCPGWPRQIMEIFVQKKKTQGQNWLRIVNSHPHLESSSFFCASGEIALPTLTIFIVCFSKRLGWFQTTFSVFPGLVHSITNIVWGKGVNLGEIGCENLGSPTCIFEFHFFVFSPDTNHLCFPEHIQPTDQQH